MTHILAAQQHSLKEEDVIVALAPALSGGQEVVDKQVAKALGLVTLPISHPPLELFLCCRILLCARGLIDLVCDALDGEEAERE